MNVYHVDTGIRFTHSEFGFIDGSPGSRAKPGFSVFGDDNTTDCFGHGTHTAATIGGKHTQSLNTHVIHTGLQCRLQAEQFIGDPTETV